MFENSCPPVEPVCSLEETAQKDQDPATLRRSQALSEPTGEQHLPVGSTELTSNTGSVKREKELTGVSPEDLYFFLADYLSN